MTQTEIVGYLKDIYPNGATTKELRIKFELTDATIYEQIRFLLNKWKQITGISNTRPKQYVWLPHDNYTAFRNDFKRSSPNFVGGE